MQVIVFVFVFALFGGAFAAPGREWYDSSSSYSDFDDEFPFGYTGAVASTSAGGAYAGSWPYTGYPFYNPFAWPFPWPVFRPTIPWYKGKNVCSEEKTINIPDDVQSWLKKSYSSSEHQSTSCRGNDKTTICEKKMVDEKGSKMLVTKYECCPGFVRPKDGSPGCVPKSSDDNETPADAPTPVRKEFHSSTGEQYSYSFSDSSSDTTRGSDVEKVPSQ